MTDTIRGTEPKTRAAGTELAEAERAFFEEGCKGVCIDDIIKRVDGSKQTIYNEFGSKKGSSRR